MNQARAYTSEATWGISLLLVGTARVNEVQGNPILNTRGGSTDDLLIRVACFVKKENIIFILETKRSKLVSTRRSTVLSLPLQ